jgi:Tol biopolymer transport system component
VSVLAGTLASATGASTGASGGQVLFSRAGGLFTINADGSGLRQITHGKDSQPAWSPNGRMIAFTREGRCDEDHPDVDVASSSGSAPRRFSTGFGCNTSAEFPVWSPKGGLAYTTEDFEVWFARSPTLKPKELVQFRAAGPVSWSPDASRFVYPLFRAWRIVVLTVAGGAERTLPPRNVDFPVWSPNGRQLAYITRYDALWTMSPTGGAPKKLVAPAPADSPIVGFPEWSPDSKYIAYDVDVHEEGTSYVIPAAGGKPVSLGAGSRPHWSPDGKRLTVVLDRTTIYTVNADGTGRMKLTAGNEAVWRPA